MSDPIERQAAIDLCDWYDNPSMHDDLEKLPSAQPETGYWISARDEDGWHMWLICSECKAKETNLKAKYCPVCGRKMA